jgi:5-methylcytosine-specific restriction endonuclease McrA
MSLNRAIAWFGICAVLVVTGLSYVTPHRDAPARLFDDAGIERALHPRCSGWERFAEKCKGEHPQCASCGLYGDDGTIEAHHIHAYELMTEAQRGTDAPGGELDPNNIILLCRPCHLKYGHLGNFKHSDPNIVSRSYRRLRADPWVEKAVFVQPCGSSIRAQ